MSSSADRARRGRVVRGALAEAARPTEPVVTGGGDLRALALELAGRLGDLSLPVDGATEAEERPDPVEVARAEGRAAGYAEGRADALAELEAARAQALAAAAEQLAEAANEAARTRQELVAEVTDDALALTYELARTLLGDGAVAASLPPRAAVEKALALAPEGRDLVVRISPASDLTADDLVGLCDPARVSIVADAAVEPGGCIVDVGACRIDTQISSALGRVRQVLDDRRRSSEPLEGTLDATEERGA